ncbi:MAG: sugar transferase [Phormidesmis sp.]
MTSRHDSLLTPLSDANLRAAVLESMGTTIQLSKSFTVVEAVSFKRSYQEAFAQNPDLKEIILDFANTTFIDSSGIGVLVICHKFCEARGAKMRLMNLPSQVMMALSLTELDKIFHIDSGSAPSSDPHCAQLADEPSAQPASQPTSKRASKQASKWASKQASKLQSALENLPETHPSVRSKAKRLMDIVGALVGLVLTAVLFVVVAIAIKREDGGPIFFAQTRCSWMGKRFKIWKFRSMVTDAEARKREVANKVEGPLFKNDQDPRITRIGRFLRRTSLDEFPQFWNVLKGDMSLVGTRPPTPDEIEQYEVSQWQRLNVKPGMTGEWQVNGRSSVTTFEEVIQLDLEYQRKWSLMYDIQLIIKTVLVLFSKKSGAM